jgi:hypothetical protein
MSLRSIRHTRDTSRGRLRTGIARYNNSSKNSNTVDATKMTLKEYVAHQKALHKKLKEAEGRENTSQKDTVQPYDFALMSYKDRDIFRKKYEFSIL